MSSSLRITGLATGLDVDSVVKQMMQAHNAKLDKVKQERQLIEWKQEAYRDLIGDINTFKSTYFDVLKSDTYMLSTKNYAGFNVTVNDTTSNATSQYISASASTGATAGTYKIDVLQLAKPDSITSSLKSGSNGDSKLSELGVTVPATLVLEYTNDGKNTVTKTITISDRSKTIRDVMDLINTETKNEVSAKYSELTNSITLQTSKTGANTSIKIKSGSTSSLLNALGISDGEGNDIEGTGAQNAMVNITPPGASQPAPTVEKSNNTFTIDGITYNLLGLPLGQSTVSANITVTDDPQKTFDKIKGFIDKYNELIDKINAKISEKKQYDYKPLTDAQKEEMTDDQIEKWENKAKQGILSRDSTLENILYEMRRAFSDTVKVNSDDPSGSSIGISLSDIGLSTSSDISQRGKIIIDENKLMDAIRNNGDKVAKLFTKTSTTVPSYSPDLTDSQSKQRYNESGIFQRISDILMDNVRTTRNKDGLKGILLEKAGIKGDYSEYNNILSDELKDKDKIISDLITKLAKKEEAYYLQFSKLESAMQKLNDQSNWLYQQLGLSSR